MIDRFLKLNLVIVCGLLVAELAVIVLFPIHMNHEREQSCRRLQQEFDRNADGYRADIQNWPRLMDAEQARHMAAGALGAVKVLDIEPSGTSLVIKSGSTRACRPRP